MTQNTEQNMRTRKQQIEDAYLNDGDFTLFQEFDRDDFEAQLHEAEARGAEERRRKDAEGCERWEFEEPEYHDQGMGCGLEDRGIHDRYQAMEYGWDQAVERCIERIPEELYTRPANVTALEAEIAFLKEAEQLARADAEASKAREEGLVTALKAADQFITNGVEFGFIRMPDIDTPDSALATPGIIRAALTREGGV